MNAPDKMYLHRTTGNNRLDGKVHPYKPAKIRDDDKIIAYIRKDALLEWAKEKIRTIANEKDDYYAGKRVAFQQVIDKLNSL